MPARAPGRAVQAGIRDIAIGATVSLIKTDSGQTVSTTVTAADGTFNLAFPAGFVPAQRKPYFLEAVKGLPVGAEPNRAGAAAARVRTLVAYSGGWSSLTGPAVVIGRASTALSIIAGHRDLPEAATMGLLDRLSGTSLSADGTAVPAQDFDRVLALVGEALIEDQDPVGAIGYFPDGASSRERWELKAGDLVLHHDFAPPIIPQGGQGVLSGQGFPGPGPATPSIFIGDCPVPEWEVNSARTRLTLTSPACSVGGLLRITRGQATWFGPFVPVKGVVGTLAGSGQSAFADGIGVAAAFSYPQGLAIDRSRNVYVCDGSNGRIRRISPLGEVSTVAGNGAAASIDGTGLGASINGPIGIAPDGSGSFYVAEAGGHRIRKLSPDGTLTTYAGDGNPGWLDGGAMAARFYSPMDVAAGPGGSLFVADAGNNMVRRIGPTGSVTTLAGRPDRSTSIDGRGTDASFIEPRGLALGPDGYLYVIEWGRIRRISPAGDVTTLAESGGFAQNPAAPAVIDYPWGIAFDGAGDLLFSESAMHRVRKVGRTGTISTLAGPEVRRPPAFQDEVLLQARFSRPRQLAIDDRGLIYVSDTFNHRVRIIAP